MNKDSRKLRLFIFTIAEGVSHEPLHKHQRKISEGLNLNDTEKL